jgi:DMSO/TMAO reductase YedYZ molybdopterin-dependent catalytic subunit
MPVEKTTRSTDLDKSAILAEARSLLAPRIVDASRRAFLTRSLTLGGVAMLSGCSLSNDDQVEGVLASISRFNDRVQGWLFDPRSLAPQYPAAMITRPFPFNAFYGLDDIPQVDQDTYRLEITGKVADKRSWRLEELHAMTQVEQITRHICVEGWSAIGRWGGVRFYTSIDMATALHPQTLLALTYDGQVLPRQYGFPMKLRMPTKLGYKNPKHIQAIFVTDTYTGGYWEDQGYSWFGGS